MAQRNASSAVEDDTCVVRCHHSQSPGERDRNRRRPRRSPLLVAEAPGDDFSPTCRAGFLPTLDRIVFENPRRPDHVGPVFIERPPSSFGGMTLSCSSRLRSWSQIAKRFPARRVDHLQAKDLSPNRHSPVLVLEVITAAWPPCRVAATRSLVRRISQQSPLGCTAHPW